MPLEIYPYQGSKGDPKKLSKVVLTDGQVVPVVRIKRGKLKSFDLHFTFRSREETEYFEQFWDAHYPGVPFIYKDCDYYPAVETTVVISIPSEPEILRSGASPNRFNYSMQLIEVAAAVVAPGDLSGAGYLMDGDGNYLMDGGGDYAAA